MSKSREELYSMGEMGSMPPVEDPPPPYNQAHNKGNQNIYPATRSSSVSAPTNPLVVVESSASWRMVAIVVGSILAGITVVVIIAVAVVLSGNGDPDKTTTSPGGTTTSPQSTTPISGWGPWTEWTDCDVTCGLGSKTRNRECYPPPELCIGSDSQVTNCYEQDCPTIEIGEWNSWESWSACSATCGGGTQSRNRTCELQSPEALDCIGSDTNTRSCSTFECPSCDRICPGGGTISPPCERCECSSAEFNGRVIATNNLPIANVKVSDVIIPSVILATTDLEGKFIINDACIFIELLLVADGYSDMQYVITSTGSTIVDITLEKIVSLQIAENPSDKMRLVGESVTFCCSVSGKPGPSYYEWFVDNNLIDPVTYNYSNTLTISTAKVEDTGKYKCRASNDYGAVFSDIAELNVKENPQDYCPLYPDTHYVELPVGCNYEGETSFNVGKCSGALCRSQNETDSGTCTETSLYCCSGSKYGHFTAQCVGYTIQVTYIIECGACSQCLDPTIVIKGTVVDASSKDPVVNAAILVNGTEVTRADQNGQFDFDVPLNIRQIVLRVQDIYGEYIETNKPIFITKGFTGIRYAHIKMHLKGTKQLGKSSEENVFSVGSGENAFGQIFIPANVLFTVDGDEFSGDFNAIVNPIDPRNMSEFDSIPSDLLFRDSQGNTQRLESYGMYALSLESIDGSLLQVKGNIQIALDASIFGSGINLVNPKLWSLDPASGLWKEKSDLIPGNETYPAWRKKIKNFEKINDIVMIGDVEYEIDITWYNFDYKNAFPCHSKVRIFKNNKFEEDSQRSGVTIKFISLNEKTGSIEASSIRSYGDDSDSDGYCMVHTCDFDIENKQDYKGYIFAEASNTNDGSLQRFIPATYPELVERGFPPDKLDNIEYDSVIDHDGGNHAAYSIFDYTITQDNGPFYTCNGEREWAYSSTCTNAAYTDAYFAFYGADADISNCPQPFYFNEEATPNGDKTENCLAWFSTSIKLYYEVCYIKVLLKGWNGKEVQARSSVGNATCDGLISQDDTYGVTYNCTKGDAETSVGCLEVKRGGELDNGHKEYFPDETLVIIHPIDSTGNIVTSCVVSAVRDCLEGNYGDKIVSELGDNEFKMYIPNSHTPFGRDNGIHCVNSEANVKNKDMARSVAEASCDATEPEPDTCYGDDENGIGWAVEFDCTTK